MQNAVKFYSHPLSASAFCAFTCTFVLDWTEQRWWKQRVYSVTHECSYWLCLVSRTLQPVRHGSVSVPKSASASNSSRAAKGTEHVFICHEYTLSGYSKLVTKLKKHFKSFVLVLAVLFQDMSENTLPKAQGLVLDLKHVHSKKSVELKYSYDGIYYHNGRNKATK